MNLTSLESSMLRGDHGDAVREALEFQVKVGEFWGAGRFVPVTNVHMMGDIEVMGDAGLDWLRAVRARDGGCVVPVTTNARCIDFACVEQFGQRPGEVAKEREIVNVLQALKVKTTDTCIGYQAIYEPRFGERIAWGDTGTVIYANSVLGARSNYESGPAALAAGLTGRVPEYGFHLDAHRRGTFTVNVESDLEDVAEWGALGGIVGAARPGYFEVPVFRGVRGEPDSDQLKHLGAALASYGSMAMFHIAGVTPEAPTFEAAFGGRDSAETITVGEAEIKRALCAPPTDGRCDLVVFSGPQLSLTELESLAREFRGVAVHEKTQVFVTTESGVLAEARRLGYADALEDAGVKVLIGVCFYILLDLSEIRVRNGWRTLATNSAKLVNTIGAHGFETVLRRTSDCVEIATQGEFR
jgi:predicted aconitase